MPKSNIKSSKKIKIKREVITPETSDSESTPEIKIEDKYIQNIGCVLWNKKRDVLDFLEQHSKKTEINESVSLYSLYCSEFKDKKRVSKNYFMNLL